MRPRAQSIRSKMLDPFGRPRMGKISPARPKAQVGRFIEIVRQLERDEEQKRFEEKLSKIAKANVPKMQKGAT